MKLSEIIKTEHDEKVDSERKVLGLNILTQLQQKLTTDEAIQKFALDIVKQSGVYLKLNNDQIQLHVRNNEENLSPKNPASINKKTILVSIPSPDESESLKRFADKLEKAFKDSFAPGASQASLVINKKSPRKDELSIITVKYCFPMRCLSWLPTLKDKYLQLVNTSNKNTNNNNIILLYGEGDGSQLPSLFCVEGVGKSKEANMDMPSMSGIVPPPMPGAVPPPIIPAEPQVQMYIAAGNQQYGPYDYSTLKSFVNTRQLTAQTLVWQQGMASWTPAGQVNELQELFMPQPPAGMPPIIPPTGPVPPPIQ